MTYPSPARAWLQENAKSLPTFGAFAIKGLGVAASFTVSVVLARIAGQEDFGHYAQATSTIIFLALISIRGLDQVILRRSSTYYQSAAFGELRWTLEHVLRVLLPRILLIVSLYIVILLTSPAVQRLSGDPPLLLLASIALVFWPLMNISTTVLRSLNTPILAQLFENMHSFLLSTVLVILYVLELQIDAFIALSLLTFFVVSSTIAQWFIIVQRFRNFSPVYPGNSLNCSKEGLPFFLSAIASGLSDYFIVVLLSFYTTASQVAEFRAVFQITVLVTIVLSTSETISMPRLARDFAKNRMDLASRRYRRMRLVAGLVTFPFITLSLYAPEALLAMTFGDDFRDAANALRVIAGAQLVNIITGPTGGILIMSHNEKRLLRFNLSALFVVIVLAILLIPQIGLLGGAIAYSFGILSRKIASFLALRTILRA